MPRKAWVTFHTNYNKKVFCARETNSSDVPHVALRCSSQVFFMNIDQCTERAANAVTFDDCSSWVSVSDFLGRNSKNFTYWRVRS